MAKKTIHVAELIDKVNDFLATSPTTDQITPDSRLGVAHFLEGILHDTGNYHGYTYLRQNQVPPGEAAGSMALSEYLAKGGNDPEVLKRGNDKWVFPDDSRRHYINHVPASKPRDKGYNPVGEAIDFFNRNGFR